MAGKKITGRTKQLSLKATPEFHQRLKELAKKEKCLMIEVLEKAVAVWEEQRQKDLAKVEKKDKISSKVLPQATPTKSSKRQFEDDDEIKEPSTNAKKRKTEK